MIKIMIVDDQELIRESLKIILSTNPDFQVVDLVSNGNEVLDRLNKNIPDVILMDVRMPEMDGVNCTRIVKKKYPNIKIIILTTFDDDEYIYDALKFGASGYLLKGLSLEELSNAIYSVMKGGSIMDPKTAAKVFKLFTDKNEETIESLGDANALNVTEWQVIEKIASGLSNKEVAALLHFSEGTVRNYISTILEKLNLRDRTQLAIWYIQSGKSIRKTREKIRND